MVNVTDDQGMDIAYETTGAEANLSAVACTNGSRHGAVLRLGSLRTHAATGRAWLLRGRRSIQWACGGADDLLQRDGQVLAWAEGGM